MAKLNGYRIVNLVYNVKDNDNSSTNRIIDQHFELDGLQSLMLLQNGGGKSVQIQMLISPFVSPKFRDFGSRHFTDYFQDDKTPTYIATEWVLDNGEKVLIGLMVRKCKPHEVTESNKGLEVYSYVYEYRDKYDEYSIGNIPFAQRTEEGYIIASSHETLDLFASIEKRNKFAMKYYNLSVSGSRTKYYEKLKTYDIERSEWESIMRTINSSEGGLTELFKNCPNEKKLIEDWFLKMIDSKLNKNLNAINSIKESFCKYFEDKQSKQHAIDIVNGIPEYTQYTNDILEINSEYKAKLSEKYENKVKIEDLYTYNYQTQKNLNSEMKKCVALEQDLEKEYARVKYTEASYNYYMTTEEHEKSKLSLDKERKQEEELNCKLTKLERDDKLQDIIKISSEKRKQEKELEEFIAKRDKENKSKEQIKVELKNVAYSLRLIVSDELDKKSELDDQLQVEKGNLDQERSDINKDIGRIWASNEALEKNIKESDKIISELKPKVSELKSKYNSPLFVDNAYFEQLENNKNDKISNKNQNINDTKKELSDLELEKSNLEKEINELDRDKFGCIYDLKAKKEDLKNIEVSCDKMTSILQSLEINTDDIFDVKYILNEIDTKLNTVNQKINSDINTKNKLQTEIEQLEKGVVVEIPNEVKNLLKDLDINYQLGLYYVSKLTISEEQKEELIKNNPFLPFSIVIKSEDIEVLKNSKVNLSSSYTVYIANMDQISTSVEYSISNTVSEVGSLKMLYNFNKALLNEDEKAKMISKRKNEIEEIEFLIENNEMYKRSLDSKRAFVQTFNITKLTVSKAKDIVNELNEKKEQLEKLIQEKTNESSKISSVKIPEKKELLVTLNEELNTLLMELDEIKQFSMDYIKLNDEFNKSIKMNEELELNNKTLEKHNNRMNELVQLESILIKKMDASRESIKESQDILENIKSLNLKFENPTIVSGDKLALEARFKVLKEESIANIKEIQENIEKLSREIEDKKNEIEDLAKINELESYEYENKEYLRENKLLISSSISKTKKEIKEQRKIVDELIRETSALKTKVDKDFEDVIKENGNVKKVYEKYNSSINIGDGPIDKVYITETNFKKSKRDIKELQKEVATEKQSINKKIDLIHTSEQQLGFLSNIREGISNIDTRVVNDDINLDNLVSVTESAIKSYTDLEYSIHNIKSKLDRMFIKLSTEFTYRDINPYAKNIKSLLELKDEPKTIEMAIKSTLDRLEQKRLKYEEDLKLMDDERRNTVNTVFKYIENVYSHMDSIDTNSSINLNLKRIKMLEIKQPDWDAVTATSKIEAFIEKVMEGCEVRYAQGETSNETPTEFIATQFTTNKLYDAIVGISNIKIIIKKLEFAGEEIDVAPISWQQAQKNSGGEGFATYFIILISLLSYMRKESSIIGDTFKESSKVLIMDNPFGKISSEHLLKPVMAIAKKYNTQLLCFTAQKGDNIYNEFENIYHLNLEILRASKTRLLTAERVVTGNIERDVYMQSTQLKLLPFN